MSGSEDYRAKANPTFSTAYMSMFLLAEAGNQDAVRMIAQMGLKNTLLDGMDSKDNPVRAALTKEELTDMYIGSQLGIEVRYNAVSKYSAAYGNFLDIACGYTPRVLTADRNGQNYIGMDIPVVAEQMQTAAEELFPERSKPTFIGGDATNMESVLSTAAGMTGDVFISTEGLLMFLNESELSELMKNIREVLMIHGGAWYSSDMGVDYNRLSATNMASADSLKKMAETKAKLGKGTAVFFDSNKLDDNGKMELLRKNGLKAELLPFYEETDSINTLDKIAADRIERIRQLLDTFKVWKITPADTDVNKGNMNTAEKVTVQNAEIIYSIDGSVMNIDLKGRIDTLNSPDLLKIIEEELDDVKIIAINCADLEYISSAGLRVLLIASKKLGSENVVLKNLSPVVSEVIETTGFDQILTIS